MKGPPGAAGWEKGVIELSACSVCGAAAGNKEEDMNRPDIEEIKRHSMWAASGSHALEVAKDNLELIAWIEQVEAALEMYGGHLRPCTLPLSHYDGQYPCSCGWEQTKEELGI